MAERGVAKARANRVKEEKAAYGAPVAGTLLVGLGVFARGERYMEELLLRAQAVSRALSEAGVPHAVIGGLAVRTHLSLVGDAGSVMTRDVDIMLRREDIKRATEALLRLGYHHREVMGLPAFIPEGKTYRDGVHVVLAGENVKPRSVHPCPQITERQLLTAHEGFVCLDIQNLVFMKLTSFRPKDIAHLQVLLENGLIPNTLEAGLPEDLRERFQQVVEQNREEGRL
jgi:hypothetical protein